MMIIIAISGVVLGLGALYGFMLLVRDVVQLVDERRHARRRVTHQRAALRQLEDRR